MSDLAQWTAILAGPLAVLLDLQVSYTMMDWACTSGNDWALHVVNATALVLSVLAALLGRSLWNRSGGAWPDPGSGSGSRSRFLAAVGALGVFLFPLTIVAMWLTVAILGPCARA